MQSVVTAFCVLYECGRDIYNQEHVKDGNFAGQSVGDANRRVLFSCLVWLFRNEGFRGENNAARWTRNEVDGVREIAADPVIEHEQSTCLLYLNKGVSCAAATITIIH